MGTTLTIPDGVKEEFEQFRVPEHDNQGDVLESLISATPTPAEILSEGCANCGESKVRDENAPIDKISGVTQVFTFDPPAHDKLDHTVTGMNWFCTVSCAAEFQEEVNRKVPDAPDIVVVGGRKETKAKLYGATFLPENPSVSIDAPGAFNGTPTNSEKEYDYIGEPVYIGNDDEWVQEYVVEDIFHEESHTALQLKYDTTVTDENRPDRSPEEMDTRGR